MRQKQDKVTEKVLEACGRAVQRIVDEFKVDMLVAGHMLVHIIDTHVATGPIGAGDEPALQPASTVARVVHQVPAGDNVPPVLEKKAGFSRGAWGQAGNKDDAQ